MKKLLALLLAMIVVLSMVACGEDVSNDDDDDDDDDDEKTTQTEKADGTGSSDGGSVVFPGFNRPQDTSSVVTDAPVTQAPVTQAPVTQPDTPVQNPGYTKGSVSNGMYINEWANVSYSFDSTWVDVTAEGNQSVAGTGTEMGLYIQNSQTGQVLQMMFEKLPVLQSDLTEDEYAQILQTQLETTYAQIGYTVSSFDISNKVIAGKIYTAFSITLSDPPIVQVMYLHKIDGYMMTICVSALDAASVNAVVSGITQAN